MAVKISGVLKDGTGKPVENCTIQLKAFLWGEYGSKDFRCTERRHRKTGRELHHSTESQTDQQHGGGEHGGL
ncbi:prophage tail fiber N-terminal domain-containing protein [Escherichia coli]|uniref:prophage tail fiber N-terminal domain-containing protein n=1 Tax=Escherichia coli TaxID=562 RepID=UPI0020244A25|nr:prophage tail fiber N-terminal domain-containing protein [Escherichia coli]